MWHGEVLSLSRQLGALNVSCTWIRRCWVAVVNVVESRINNRHTSGHSWEGSPRLVLASETICGVYLDYINWGEVGWSSQWGWHHFPSRESGTVRGWRKYPENKRNTSLISFCCFDLTSRIKPFFCKLFLLGAFYHINWKRTKISMFP